MLGANRAGKSTLGSAEVSYHATGQYPAWWQGYKFDRPVSIWACGESIAAARDIVQEKLCGDPSHFGQGMIPAESILDVRRKPGIPDAIDVVTVRHVSGGVSTVQFKSYASGRTDFQGRRLDFIWMDEEAGEKIVAKAQQYHDEGDEETASLLMTSLAAAAAPTDEEIVERNEQLQGIHQGMKDSNIDKYNAAYFKAKESSLAGLKRFMKPRRLKPILKNMNSRKFRLHSPEFMESDHGTS